MEEWRLIKGFENYLISSNAIIKNIKTGRIIKGSLNNKGYIRVDLCVNGKRIVRSMHRLMAETFLPNPDNKESVNHINGIKSDNRLENLEWCTQQENMQHAYMVLDVKQHNIRPVIRLDTQEVFESISDAARKIGGTPEGIIKVCKKQRRTYKGIVWEYYKK